MDIIRKIINEEIDRLIINENINTLGQYANNINNQLNRIKNYTITDASLSNFISGFEIYCIQVINAIKRCIKANSLNEGLRDWGINIPPELGGNFWNDARMGYYATKRGLQRFFNNNGYGYGKNGNGNRTSNNVNPRTVPSVRLFKLMEQYPEKKAECEYRNSRENLYTQVPPIFAIVQNLDKIYGEYHYLSQQQNNAQGSNP